MPRHLGHRYARTGDNTEPVQLYRPNRSRSDTFYSQERSTGAGPKHIKITDVELFVVEKEPGQELVFIDVKIDESIGGNSMS